MAQACRGGIAVSVSDGYIAAAAAASGMMAASRGNTPFEAAGLRVIDPREAGPGRRSDSACAARYSLGAYLARMR